MHKNEQRGCFVYLLDKSIFLKSKLIVVVEIGELLLGNLYTTRTRDVIDTSLLKEVIEGITLIVETSGTNFTTVVQQIDTEQFALAIFVVPCLNTGLAGASRFHRPFVGIRRDSFDGIDCSMGRGSRRGSHRLGPAGGLSLRALHLGAVESIAGNCCRLVGLLFLAFHFEWLGFPNFVRLAEFLQNFKVQDDENSAIDQYDPGRYFK